MKIYSRTERARLYADGMLVNLWRVLPQGRTDWILCAAFIVFTLMPHSSDFVHGMMFAGWLSIFVGWYIILRDYSKLYVRFNQWREVRGYVIRHGEKFPICLIVPPTVEATNRDIVKQIKGQV